MYSFTEFQEIEKTIGTGRYVVTVMERICLQPDSPTYRDSFARILGALQTNWARVQQLAIFPTYLMQEAMRHQKHLDIAAFNVLGRVEIGRVDKAQKQAIWDEYDRLPMRGVETRERAGTDDFANRDSGIALALSTLVSAIIINAWTAYEVAATDIWIAALNERPNKLGAKMAHAKSSNEGQSADQGKQIRITELQKHGFDMRRHMGDVLADKFNFKNSDGIYDTYRKTFDQNESIYKLLKRKGLRPLNLVRNLLVHRGGKIDQEFLKQIGHHSDFGQVANTPDLRLEAKQVIALCDAAFEASTELLFAVNDWLDANPD